MKISLLFVLAPLFAAIVTSGCATAVTGEMVEKFYCAEEGAGKVEYTFTPEPGFREGLKKRAEAERDAEEELESFDYNPDAEDSLKYLAALAAMTDEEFAAALEEEFFRAYEAGLFLVSQEFDRRTLRLHYVGYFNHAGFADRFHPGCLYDSSVFIPGISFIFEERTCDQQYGAWAAVRGHPTLIPLDMSSDDPDDMKEAACATSEVNLLGNFHLVREYRGFGTIRDSAGLRIEGDATILEFDYRKYVSDPEYNENFNKILSVDENIFVSFKRPKEDTKAAQEEEALVRDLYRAKVECTERYLELLKKYPPEEPKEETTEETGEKEPEKESGE